MDVTLGGAIAACVELDDVKLTETRYRPHERLSPHEHGAPMFVLVLGGDFDERFGTRDRSCTQYDLIFRPVGETHSDRFGVSGGACLTMELHAEEFDPLLSGTDGRIPLQGMPALLAMRVYDAMHRRSMLDMEESIALLAAAASSRRTVVERRNPPWLKRARDSIHDSLTSSIQLSQLAQAVGVHRVHLSRTFQQFYGCTVAEYVRRLRVHRACGELRGGARTLSTVAFRNGFSDESHMGRTFRQIMGCTPGQYR